MKCLEFGLPSGPGGLAAGFARQILVKQLEQIKKNHNINYKTTTEQYRLFVWLEKDEYYTLFFLVWDTTQVSRIPVLIEKDYPTEWGTNPWVQSEKKT